MPIRPNYMNRQRFDALLEASPYDAVVATSFKNVYYLSGALIETIRRIPMRLAMVVWPRDGEPTLIVGDIEESIALRESHLGDVRAYVEFRTSPIEALAKVLAEKGLAKGHLGIELEHLMAVYYLEVQERIPGAEFSAADRLFDEVRVIKTQAEVKLMTHAAHVTERAIRESYQASRPGWQEKQVGLELIRRLITGGADTMRFLVLGAAENGIHAHHIPSERALNPGETVRLDVGAYFSGYASDIARMAFVEPPNKAQLDLYQRIHEIHLETLAAIRPGVRASDVYEACRAAFDARSLKLSMPHVGHGFGVDGGHEEPLLHPLNERVLETGMVLAVEPVYSDPTLGGYHLEDLLLVTDDGVEVLSNATNTDEPFVITDGPPEGPTATEEA